MSDDCAQSKKVSTMALIVSDIFCLFQVVNKSKESVKRKNASQSAKRGIESLGKKRLLSFSECVHDKRHRICTILYERQDGAVFPHGIFSSEYNDLMY
jgi:hypothetical protein